MTHQISKYQTSKEDFSELQRLLNEQLKRQQKPKTLN